ncbi:hypothetical protein HYH03_000960 [Edaphochlamys debaryana]|uniref:Transmembrane protein 231 n=1 Tax=Edaphochlamys debaryana TaxID=47281 RepID=A0A835YH72_9CHLO|nr:hypothetical protein HYH03_000960 [Edaphochlamys debaryana]|eukprot:KAG2501143.1 hypothetical protein HYH03_000960 [Edaphochlamys debaryana]
MVWSTSEAINMQFANAYTPASVEVASQDLNNDGKADVIAFRAQVAGNFPIHSVKALLQFQYSLTGHLQLDMYGLAYVEHSSPIQGNALYTDGELLLVQKNQIQDKKYNGLYNVPLLNSSRPTVLTAVQPSMELELQSIIKSYNERNYTTMLTNNYPVWTGGSRNAFELLMMIRIPPNQVVWYRPLAIQMIKFGWIQWLAGYVVLWWILQWVEWFLFSYRLLETRVVSDFQPKKLRF